MLKDTFFKLLSKYNASKEQKEALWNEIEQNYSNRNRHYHSLEHLDKMLFYLTKIKAKIQNWETILFALYYHDIIYNSRKSNNEEESAKLAKKRMLEISIPNDIIQQSTAQIIATKKHSISENSDTNYLLDVDLSILGQNWKTYLTYTKNVRKEYAIYPDFLYKPGRKKVLHHFLNMERIFKTDYFYDLFEKQAKENLKRELDLF